MRMRHCIIVILCFSIVGCAPTPRIQSCTSTCDGLGLTLLLDDNINLELVTIPSGSFVMGARAKNRLPNEYPAHKVFIRSPFLMGKVVVTQEQYMAVVGKNPSKFIGAKNPVDSVTWNDAKEFCQELSKKLKREVRLPSEAEWEYACRAGTQALFSFGDDDGLLRYYSKFGSSPESHSRSVGEKLPNPWGLYDMHGLIWEWCEDVYTPDYKDAPMDGRAVVISSLAMCRVCRGGDWESSAFYVVCSSRMGKPVDIANSNRGFRIVMDLKPKN